MNRNRKKPSETRKLTQQQKKLLVEKIQELEDSYTGRGKISSQKLAQIIGPRFLKRTISDKIVQKYRKKDVAEKIKQQPDSASKLVHLISEEVVAWEEKFDRVLTEAFSYANLTLAIIIKLAYHFVQTCAHPKKQKFAKTWCRSYLKRHKYSYKRIRGHKKKIVVASGVIQKADTELKSILADYDDSQVRVKSGL